MIHKQYPRVIRVPERSFFLFGVRGVGKSTWLRQQFPDAIEVNLLIESTYQGLLADSERFLRLTSAAKRDDWVIVDEVQRLPHLLNEVHHLIESRGIRFALSGSSARKLRRGGVNLLAGRAVHRALYPLCREELGDDFDLEHVLHQGSLPLVWHRTDAEEILEAYVQTYLKEEIQAEALVRHLPGFHRFLPIAALFNAQILNVASLARDAGVSRTTVHGFLDILDDTLLTFRLPPFEGRLRVKERKHPKLYWIDTGIVRAVKKSRNHIVPEERGALFESWIASTLLAYRSYKKTFDDWHYWAATGSESIGVDFLLWRANRCIAIEVKAGNRYRKEYIKGLRALKGAGTLTVHRAILVYCGTEAFLEEGDIEILPVTRILDELESGTLWNDR